MVNPTQIKSYGKSRLARTKTGKVDARLIADFCAERNPAPWQASGEAELTLRALVLRLVSLQTMHTQESNRLGMSREAVRGNIQAHLDWLDKEIDSLIQAIKDHINNHPGLKRQRDLLGSIQGVGERTIAAILAFYADTGRFANSRQAAALSQVLILAIMSPVAASGVSLRCPKSIMPSCARLYTCPPWCTLQDRLGQALQRPVDESG